MEGKAATENGELLIGVGLTGGRKSKDILKWAIEKDLYKGNVRFKLLHVYPKITAIPTPMGKWLPIAQVPEDIAARFRQETEWKKKKLLLPCLRIIKAYKVKADIVLLESDDIAKEISLAVTKLSIRHLIIGVSSSTWSISWKNLSVKKGAKNLSAIISETVPDFCSVYAVAARKLEHLRPADLKPNIHLGLYNNRLPSPVYTEEPTEKGLAYTSLSTSQPIEPEFSHKEIASSETSERESMELNHIYPEMDFSFGNSSVTTRSSTSEDSESSFLANSGGSFAGTLSRYQSCAESFADSETSASPGQIFDLEKLRTELRHTRKTDELAGNSVSNETFFFPLNQLDDLGKWQLEEALTLMEESPNESKTKEINNPKAAQSEAINSEENTERNTPDKKAEKKACQETKDNNNKLKQEFEDTGIQYENLTFKEILKATSSFSDEFRIGTGALGTVYKCKLQHTTVAVKILHTKDSAIYNQFLEKLEIMSKTSHPHILRLLGSILEERCLVYEYMENGSLEDRLFRKHGRPPLPWYDRFRICWEVAGALAFLHSTKPAPIIYRDLKLVNILLDQDLVSKIADASLVGSLYYLDPEYQRTGTVSTKSDIYALGVVILQLLTAKPGLGIASIVEDAIGESNLMKVLDPEAGKWPEEEALELALLGLQCAELRGRDRPDLREEVLPALARLKRVAESAKEQA